jgi:hypothetical protein
MQTAAMARYNLRNASIVSHDVNTLDAIQTDNDENICVICQESLSDDQNVVSLRCCHHFHGQCLCDHLLHDVRCPICRDSPYPDPSDFDSDSDDGEPRGVTVKEVIKNAKANRKTCKQTDRMLKTISKWRKERKEVRTRVRALYQCLNPLEDAIYKKVEDMEKKLFANLKRREAALYDSIDKTRNESSRASANYTGAQLRVAQKYGYQRPLAGPDATGSADRAIRRRWRSEVSPLTSAGACETLHAEHPARQREDERIGGTARAGRQEGPRVPFITQTLNNSLTQSQRSKSPPPPLARSLEERSRDLRRVRPRL